MLDIWEQNKYKVLQIDLSATKRESKWALVCPECQWERIGSYCQAWNIVKNKNSGKCLRCVNKNKTPPNIPWNKGKLGWKKKFSEEQSRKMKLIHSLGHKFVNEEGKLKQRKAKLGKRGKETNRYIDGRSRINHGLRRTPEYKDLRLKIFIRDNYTCQICNIRGGKLEMDHIKEWCNYPELRFEESNCRTLCKSCHTTTPNYKHKAIKKVS